MAASLKKLLKISAHSAESVIILFPSCNAIFELVGLLSEKRSLIYFQIYFPGEGEGDTNKSIWNLWKILLPLKKRCAGWEARGLRLPRNPQGLGHGLLSPTPLNTPLTVINIFEKIGANRMIQDGDTYVHIL